MKGLKKNMNKKVTIIAGLFLIIIGVVLFCMAMNNVGGNIFIIVQSLVVVLAIINVVNIFFLQKKRK